MKKFSTKPKIISVKDVNRVIIKVIYKDYMELQNLKEEKLESFYQKTKLEDELKKLREQRNNSYRETLNIEKELLMLKLRKKI